MKQLKILLIFIFTLFILHAKTVNIEDISINLQNLLQTHIKGQNRDIVQNIYAKTGNKPLWINGENSKKMSQLIQALKDPLFNYKNIPFDQKAIKKLLYLIDNNNVSIEQQTAVYARVDLMLTNSMVRLIRFIVQGDVDWQLVQQKFKALKDSDNIQINWEMASKPFPDQDKLIYAIINGDIISYLNSLIPMEKRYKKLIKLLKNYRAMDKFPKIKYYNSSLKLGDWSGRVIDIKKRLQISGDYPKNANLDRTFNKILQKAVITYQKRYLLKVTGEVDKTMTYYLNQPVKKNIQAIITNLDKTKLYPKSFEDEYIEVNIADFNLRYYQNNNIIAKIGIVVGRVDRPTPIFSDEIEYMVLNPTWTVTDNLIKKDLIPYLENHPNYLTNHNIHVFLNQKEVEVDYTLLAPFIHDKKHIPYRFVQYPGDNNALGRVKFIFPNKYSVYLHDTDNKTLLTRRYKLYSSGCIRVDKPFKLMNILLQHAKNSYNQSDIDEIIATNKPKTIKLIKHIPVHIIYFTVYEEDNLAYFKNDIYLYDKIIEESTTKNKKNTFTLPANRMISVNKNAQLKKD